MKELMNLQITMFFLMFIGLMFRRWNIITAEGKQCLTDLILNLIMPATVFNSFLIKFTDDIIRNFVVILLIGVIAQLISIAACFVLYKKESAERKKVLRYGIICSNAGFLGYPIAEGVFGSMGLSLASIFLIPMQIAMWSAGISFFTNSSDWKTVVKKVVTHPCILAAMAGILFMMLQLSLPASVGKTIQLLANCNTALSMLVIGTILYDVDYKTLMEKTVFSFTIIRLILLPAIVFAIGTIMKTDPLVRGVSTILMAMPAGATTAILAAKYDGDAIFGSKCVVISTVTSLVTTFLWSMILL